MVCNNCGEKIIEGAKFCPMCGTEVTNDMKNKKKVNPFVLAGIAGASLVLGLIILFATRKPNINLNDYLTIEVSGYNARGTVSYDFDDEALQEDYGEIIEKNMDKETLNKFGMNKYAKFIGVKGLLMNCIDGSFDKRTELSNGDKVTFVWDCDDEVAKESYGVKLKYSDVEVKIEDLEEVEEVNPFEGIEVVFSGYAPNGQAEIVIDDDKVVIPELKYELSDSDDLKNGDIVTVYISNIIWDPEYFEKNYGVTLTETKKEFVVEGLSQYADSPDDINEEMFNQLLSESKEIVSAECSQNNIQYVENYWLGLSEDYDTYYGNQLIYVYQVGAQGEGYTVTFENIALDKGKAVYENVIAESISSIQGMQGYVERQMARNDLDYCEANIGTGISLPVEEAVAIPAEVDVENLTEDQQEMYYIMDALADCCYYDIYEPSNPSFFWSALKAFVSFNSADWSEGYSEMGLLVKQDKIEKIAAGLFESYNGLLDIPESEYIIEENDSYTFMAGDRGMEYTKITSWTVQADGTDKVTMELIDEMENEVYAIYEFTLVPNPRLQYDKEQVFQYSVRNVEKIY